MIFNMKKYVLLIALPATFFCCRGKKVSLSGNESVTANEFIESFETVKAPYEIGDSIFDKEENDSSLIGYKIFTQFVPDTVITRHYPKGTKPDLYPVAKIRNGKKETYLFCKSQTDAKEILYLLCFDKSDRFIASKVLFAYDKNYHSMAAVDPKWTITVIRRHRSPEGELLYKKDAYVLNGTGGFILILTESNEAAARNLGIINPIDTLPRRHKYSGDYVIDKKNLISVRDGKNTASFLFFVHFEKEAGTCNGELKGEAKFTSPATAQFHGSSDPCTIHFSFAANKIIMKEIEGCGNHRDIKCFFEGEFTRKKEVKPRLPVTRKKGHP
jgi:hypothetical protein